MRKLLDKMFANKKLSLFIPLLTAALLYLLFIIFGVAEDKINIIIATPIVCVFWFFGMFLVLYVQIKNTACPEGFLNFFEFAVMLLFGVFSIVFAISVVINGFNGYTPSASAGFLTYASISWAHSKRKK